MQTLIIENRCAPGDVTVLSALFRDIATKYPGKYDLQYAGHCKQLFWYNPHVTKIYDHVPAGQVGYNLEYGSYLNKANQVSGPKDHFLLAFYKSLKKATGIEVELQLPKGDLHLTPEEKSQRPLTERYWAIFPGWKGDFTTKQWSVANWQMLVNALRMLNITCLQCGATGGKPAHVNPLLSGAVSAIGKTDLRGLLQLIYHAEGVICGVTSAMHIAAVFDKPCVVMAGSREGWWWEAYVNSGIASFGARASGKVKVPHKFLHTFGLLNCCKNVSAGVGCWLNKVEKSEPDKYKSYCQQPVDDGQGQVLPACQQMISMEHVLAAVLSYYEDNVLPPIGPKPTIILPDGVPLATPQVQTLLKTPPPLGQINKSIVAIPAVAVQPVDGNTAIADPIIGGKMTIFVLLYGDYADLHKMCLNSILSTVPREYRDLRIGANAVCDATVQYLSRLKDSGQVNIVYSSQANLKKYPMMRRMFHDVENPITTKWLVWFDDDSIANKDPAWFSKMAQAIVHAYPNNVRMLGRANYWSFSASQVAWLKSRPWYKNRPLQLANGMPAPNARGVQFATGDFWAMEVAAMQKANIPDVDLGHNGGDYVVGAQLWQAGFNIKGWNNSRQFICASSCKRRGLSEKHTGTPGWIPGGCN